jgi:hypothetical protein
LNPGDELNIAKRLGCRIEYRHRRWHWSHGTHARSSNDHYGISFASEAEAAVHFLKSHEGQIAIARRMRELKKPNLRVVHP